MIFNTWNFFLIFVGGGLGACTRWIVDGFIASHLKTGLWPAGTFVVNMSGCLIIGLLLGWFARDRESAMPLWLLASTGFTGAFTTFSTFCLQLFELHIEKQSLAALLYAAVSVVLGFILVAFGYSLTKAS